LYESAIYKFPFESENICPGLLNVANVPVASTLPEAPVSDPARVDT
jgi:hypothetical protein